MATTIAAPKKKRAPAAEQDFLPLEARSHRILRRQRQTGGAFLQERLRFPKLGYSGPETGVKDRASYAIRQNKLTFVLTTPTGRTIRSQITFINTATGESDCPQSEGRDLAWKETTSARQELPGTENVEGQARQSRHERITLTAKSCTCSSSVTITPARSCPASKMESPFETKETGLLYCDHCVGNVGWNQMNPWVKFYEDVMGFRNILTFDDKDIRPNTRRS